MKIRIVEGLLICTIYTMVVKMAEVLFDRLAFWGDVLLVVGWIFILTFVLLKSRGKFLAFKTTGRILSFFHINNPDYFPMLNEVALKKHILLIIENKDLPLNILIDKVSLYQGADETKYVLVVKLKIDEQYPDFSKFMNHWQPDSLRFLAHKNFGAEVYRSGYSSDLCLLNDWLIWVQSLNEELPDDEIIIKKYSWVLFKKNWYARIKQRAEQEQYN